MDERELIRKDRLVKIIQDGDYLWGFDSHGKLYYRGNHYNSAEIEMALGTDGYFETAFYPKGHEYEFNTEIRNRGKQILLKERIRNVNS